MPLQKRQASSSIASTSTTSTALPTPTTPLTLGDDQTIQYQLEFQETPVQGSNNTTIMIPELQMEPVIQSSAVDGLGDGDDFGSGLLTVTTTTSSTSTSATSTPTAPPTPPRAALADDALSTLTTITGTTSASTPTPAPTSTSTTLPSLQQDNLPASPTTNTSSSSFPTATATSTPSSNRIIHSDGNGMFTIGNNGPTLSTAAIVGICIGAAAVLILILGLCIWCCCRKSNRNKSRREGQRHLQLENAAKSAEKPGNKSVAVKTSNKKLTKKQKKAAAAAQKATIDGQRMVEKRDLVFGRNSRENQRQQQQKVSQQQPRLGGAGAFQRLSSDDGHAGGYSQIDDAVEGYYHDPTLNTFASYFETGKADELPSNYKVVEANANPFDEATRPSLPYYKNGRLSTGRGLTPATNSMTVPPLMPTVPARVAAPAPPSKGGRMGASTATGQVLQAKKAKLVNGGQAVACAKYPQSPMEGSTIQFRDAAVDEERGDIVAPLRSTVRGAPKSYNSLQRSTTAAPMRAVSRDTMTSMYSMESAQENHDYGDQQVPPMPAMRRYI